MKWPPMGNAASVRGARAAAARALRASQPEHADPDSFALAAREAAPRSPMTCALSATPSRSKPRTETHPGHQRCGCSTARLAIAARALFSSADSDVTLVRGCENMLPVRRARLARSAPRAGESAELLHEAERVGFDPLRDKLAVGDRVNLGARHTSGVTPAPEFPEPRPLYRNR